MKKWLHYTLLLTAALCFLAGTVIVLVGYLRYLNAYETYRLEICQVVNRSTTSTSSIELRVVHFVNSTYRKWFMVNSLSLYPLMTEIPCYVSASKINSTILIIHDVEIEAYSDIISLILGLILLGLCLVLLLIFIIIGVLEKRSRTVYTDIDELPSDFSYQENLDVVLSNFEEAQRYLWMNQSKIRENTFERLKQDQIIAMLGGKTVRLKFQQDVHNLLSKL